MMLAGVILRKRFLNEVFRIGRIPARLEPEIEQPLLITPDELLKCFRISRIDFPDQFGVFILLFFESPVYRHDSVDLSPDKKASIR